MLELKFVSGKFFYLLTCTKFKQFLLVSAWRLSVMQSSEMTGEKSGHNLLIYPHAHCISFGGFGTSQGELWHWISTSQNTTATEELRHLIEVRRRPVTKSVNSIEPTFTRYWGIILSVASIFLPQWVIVYHYLTRNVLVISRNLKIDF